MCHIYSNNAMRYEKLVQQILKEKIFNFITDTKDRVKLQKLKLEIDSSYLKRFKAVNIILNSRSIFPCSNRYSILLNILESINSKFFLKILLIWHFLKE